MAYIRWYLVNPHVQKIQNMYGKGGKRVSKAELQTAKVDPYFERKKTPLAVFQKASRPQF